MYWSIDCQILFRNCSCSSKLKKGPETFVVDFFNVFILSLIFGKDISRSPTDRISDLPGSTSWALVLLTGIGYPAKVYVQLDLEPRASRILGKQPANCFPAAPPSCMSSSLTWSCGESIGSPTKRLVLRVNNIDRGVMWAEIRAY